MTQPLITLTHGDTMISSPDSGLVLQVLTGLAASNAPIASPSVPALGEYWPGQGGVNAGLVRGTDGTPDYYLIVGTEDLGKFEWGGYGSEVKGASSPSDGYANTKSLLADGEHPAAIACAEYQADGHADFFLPSRRELQVAEANVSELFAKEWHWSSSQRSAYYAFFMLFADGLQSGSVKGSGLRVRPVRRFIR